MRGLETAAFSVAGNNGIFKLELSKSLLRFTEFDFTYFWEQCIEAGRNARKTGRISDKLKTMAMSALVKCHPYVEACAGSEFSAVVIDCIIAYICHSEGIGLEELWARCISPKSLYEKAIFFRLSEYKTGRGINQWINIVRMQEYARSKTSFIYETENNVMLSPAEYRTRREYFDLAFSVAANETGCPMEQMPSVRKYSPSSLPDSVFMLGRMSKSIYRRLSEVLGNAEMWEEKQLNFHNRDQTALDAFSYVKDMPRPAQIDMDSALEAVCALPETIYVPDSFKALIDLEFTLMWEEGIYLAKCPRCGKFFNRAPGEISPYCSRVNSTGRTCAELIESELGIAAAVRPGAEEILPELPEELPPETAPFEEETLIKAPEAATEENIPVREAPVIKETVPEDTPAYEIPKELEKRCQKVYNMLYKRIGKLMTNEEFSEWSKYLSDMKKNVREGNGDIPQMTAFLEYWETAARNYSSRRSRRAKREEPENVQTTFDNYSPKSEDPSPEPEPVRFEPFVPVVLGKEPEKAREPQTDPDVMQYDTGGDLSRMFNDAVREAEEKDDEGISPEAAATTLEERGFKPFVPPKYNTVLEAMLDGKYKSDELLSETAGLPGEDISEIRVNGKKVKLPDWEKIQKE